VEVVVEFKATTSTLLDLTIRLIWTPRPKLARFDSDWNSKETGRIHRRYNV
jgi:hypothetical protein